MSDNDDFYDQPTVFVCTRTAGYLCMLPPIDGGPKRRFQFENHQLAFEPKDRRYRDKLLQICNEQGAGFPIQPVDRERAAAIAMQHSQSMFGQLNANLNTRNTEAGMGQSETLNLASSMLRQSGQTAESVASALGVPIDTVKALQLIPTDDGPAGPYANDIVSASGSENAAAAPDDGIDPSVEPAQELEVVKPSDDGASSLASMLTGKQ